MVEVTKKRRLHHHRHHDEEYKLGAGEFSTILNGDDARQMLRALTNFTKTVKRERRQALNVVDNAGDHFRDDEEESDEEEKSDEVIESNKKLKEEWMEDSKDYNVPFVGTSVAKGDVGRVVVGQWPTGFLEAYLRQSPLAVELTSDNLIPPSGHVHKKLLRQKLGKKSYALYKAYLYALSELATAAIPISSLKVIYGIDTSGMNDVKEQQDQPKFMAGFIKDRFPDLVQMLNEETASGRGKAGSISGVGQLAAPVLQIITHLASSALGTSRQVVRSLDASLRDGVLKVLLREPRKSHEASTRDNGEEGTEEYKQLDRLAVPYKTRASCLRLAVALLEMRDPSIASYISTIGSRERKNSPGILYLAFRYGFEDSMFREQGNVTESQTKYLESLSLLLQATIVMLEDDRDGLLSRRALADLLGADALTNVTQAATRAPPLNSYNDVLRGVDEYQDKVTPLEDVGIKARRLLFLLLADASRSPFLKRISGKDDDKLSSIYMTFMVKALNQVLNASPSIHTQNFIIYSMTETPLLLPGFFRYIKIPDVNATFAFLSRLHLVSRIMKEGPPPSACLVVTDLSPRGIENTLSNLLPQHLNKQVLSRALQSSNPLTVFEAAKTILRSISRYRLMVVSFKNSSFQELVSKAFLSRLPDVQALVSTRSKFDPFANEKKDSVLVNGLICRVLEDLAETFPIAVTSVKFDWTKLLPDPISLFRKARPVAQLRILQTLEKIIKCKNANSRETSKPAPKTCCALLEVCITASHEKIYASARSIATEMLLRLLDCPTERTEMSFCMEYEVSLWIDAMDQSVISEFQSLLDDTVKNAFHHKLYSIQAWKNANMPCAIPPLPFTLLLPAAWSGIENISDAFACLVRRVTARCQLFHSNPVPLASMIHHTCRHKTHESDLETLVLEEYARCILDLCRSPFDCGQSFEVSLQAEKLIATFACFSATATNEKPACIGKCRATDCDAQLYLRRCLQTIALVHGFVETEDVERQLIENACGSIRGFVKRREFKPIVMLLNHPAVVQRYLPNRLRGLVDLITAACSGNHVRHLDSIAALIASSLSKLGAKLADVELFDLIELWFCSEFVTIAQFDTVGAALVRLASVSFARKATDNSTVQSLALHWTQRQSVRISTVTAWDAWIVYTSEKETVRESDCLMIRMLEEELCKAAGEQACVLFVRIHEFGPHEFLRRCLRSFHLTKVCNGGSDHDFSLLSKAIDVGCHDIGQILVLLTAASDGEFNVDSLLSDLGTTSDDFKDLWHSGFLDMALASASQNRNDAVVHRSLSNTLKDTKSPDKGFLLASKILNQQSVDVKFKPSAQTGRLLKSIVMWNEEERPIQGELQSLCELVLLIDAVPHALKNVFKSSIPDGVCISFCATVLEQCIRAIEICESDFFINVPLDVDSILKSCLKFGVSNADGALSKLRSSCLKIVRLLLCAICKPGSESLQSSNPLLRPGTVWTLVLSHSKFAEAFIATEGSTDKDFKYAMEELVNLLVCCASLSADKLYIERNALNSLLAAYNGGTLSLDISLRRLLHLIESIEGVQMPSADEIGAFLSSSSAVHVCDKGWGFLGNTLEMRRIQATLSQFPAGAYLSPLPLPFETWTTGEIRTDASMAVNLDDSQGLTTGSCLPTGDEDDTVAEVVEQEVEEGGCRDIWRGRGPDLRYDPSFVIPLIVSALEALASEVTDDSHAGQSEGFARLAQTLCENGGMSLCLATLCSECPSLRKLAFCGLCLFLLALDSDAGKDLTTWRERPQLKMLLTSVQVGFVLRKAMLSSNGLGHEIPKLPSLSAVFLGKASLILSKPGDALYSAMNKYFLKLNQNHGAFSDMTRLPAFIALFCSSSEEHPEKERHWVLQFLRDSFLGGYHMISSCHAPELLLTTLGRRHVDDMERMLILQVLTRLLQFGGKQAMHHLLDRIGLLPWLQALLVSQPLSADATSAVLDLVEVAVLQGMTYVEENQRDQLVLDLRNLLKPVAAVQSNTARRVFRFIAHSLSELGYRETLAPAGISIPQSFQLMSASDNKSAMLAALCSSPLQPGQESEVTHYCEALLRSLIDLPEACVSIVLTRVEHLVRECPSIPSWPNELVRLILSLHTRAVRIKAYGECLTTLLGKADTLGHADNERDEWLCLAASTVRIIQETASAG